MVFYNYRVAFNHAKIKARESGLDVAIRKVNEFGKIKFAVSFACKMDSDYAKAEIVTKNTF